MPDLMEFEGEFCGPRARLFETLNEPCSEIRGLERCRTCGAAHTLVYVNQKGELDTFQL
jgi:hypothetical protein